MSDIEHEDPFSFRSLAELPRQTDPANAHIRPEVFLQWTFVAEIVAVTASEHYHTSLVVRDGDEQVLSVGFDLNDNDNNRLDELVRTTFKTGCTLLILDAHKVEIRCGRNVTGIVVNDIGHIKISPAVLPCWRYWHLLQAPGIRPLWKMATVSAMDVSAVAAAFILALYAGWPTFVTANARLPLPMLVFTLAIVVSFVTLISRTYFTKGCF